MKFHFISRLSAVLFLTSFLFASCAHSSQVSPQVKRPAYIYPERSFDYKGAKVCYVDAGKPDGEPIIFLHGVLGDVHLWRKTMKALEKDYRVLAIDLPGYGKSDKGEQIPMSISYYAGLIHDLIELKQLKKPVLAGVSLSGHIVLYYALNFPDEIGKAVVVGSVGVDREMRWHEELEYAALWHNFIIDKILTRKNFQKIWTQQFSCTREYDAEYDQMPIFHDPKEHELFIASFNNSISSIFFTSLRDSVKEIRTPLLILWGGFDQHHGVQDAYYLHEQVPGSKLAISPQCGHLLMLDDPEFFDRALSNFLRTGDPEVPSVSLAKIRELAKQKGVKLKEPKISLTTLSVTAVKSLGEKMMPKDDENGISEGSSKG